MDIHFTDICYITEDVLRLRAFYELVFGGKAEGDEVHSGLRLGGMHFSFDSATLLRDNPAFCYVSAGSSNGVIAGFIVDDVDSQYTRLLQSGVETLNQPTTHPWGARSFQFKDPDGNILNFRSIIDND